VRPRCAHTHPPWQTLLAPRARTAPHRPRLSCAPCASRDEGAAALCAAAAGSKLAALDLRVCGLSAAAGASFAALLAAPGCPLRTLALADNALGAEGARRAAAHPPRASADARAAPPLCPAHRAGVAALAAGLRGAALQTLDLSGTGAGDAGAAALAAALPGGALSHLLLDRCGVSAAGAAALAAALAAGAPLAHLALQGNGALGDAGAEALAAALAGAPPAAGEQPAPQPRLLRLDVGACGIGAAGAAALLRAGGVASLSLCGNEGVGDAGAAAAAAALAALPAAALAPAALDLSGCGIGAPGAAALAAALSGGAAAALRTLELGANPVRPRHARAVPPAACAARA
jgi:hypothetical protein